MVRVPSCSCVALAALTLIGCKGSGGEAVDGGASASASVPSTVTAPPPATSASSPDAGRPAAAPLELLKFRFTSGLHGREPKDDLSAAEPGKRVWAHLTLRNKSGETRAVKVIFRVNGDKRTTLDLDVEPSWSFRTWGYNTLRDGDGGELSVEVTDDTGATLVSEKIPIRRGKDAGKDAGK